MRRLLATLGMVGALAFGGCDSIREPQSDVGVKQEKEVFLEGVVFNESKDLVSESNPYAFALKTKDGTEVPISVGMKYASAADALINVGDRVRIYQGAVKTNGQRSYLYLEGVLPKHIEVIERASNSE